MYIVYKQSIVLKQNQVWYINKAVVSKNVLEFGYLKYQMLLFYNRLSVTKK